MVFVSFWRAPGRPKRVVFGSKKAIFERIWRRKVSLIHVRRLCFQDRLIFVEFQKSLKTIGFTTIFWCADPDRKRFFISAIIFFMFLCWFFCFFWFFSNVLCFFMIFGDFGPPGVPKVTRSRFWSSKVPKTTVFIRFLLIFGFPIGASVIVLWMNLEWI